MELYPKELTTLLAEYLSDGIISAKERQVLLKKAVALGIDADEFDLYIDAQQNKLDQEIDAAASKKRGKICPFCGGQVPQLTDKCPHCDKIITAEASKELEELMSTMEKYLVEMKAGDIEQYQRNKALLESVIRKARTFYMSNERVHLLVEELQQEIKKADEKLSKRKILTYLKTHKLLSFIVGVCLIAMGCFVVKNYLISDPTLHGKDCYNAVHKAIENNNLVEAKTILEAFYNYHRYSAHDDPNYEKAKSELSEKCYQIVHEAIKSGNIVEARAGEQAIHFDGRTDSYHTKVNQELAEYYWSKGDYKEAANVDLSGKFRLMTCQKLIEQGQFEEALEYETDETRQQLVQHFLDAEDYNSVITTFRGRGDDKLLQGAQMCITHMLKNGKREEAQAFVNTVCTYFTDDEVAEKVHSKLSESKAKEILMEMLD